MSSSDLEYWSKWGPASGSPAGWRVTRGLSPMEELCGKTGNRIYFRTLEAAQKRADKMNQKNQLEHNS